MYKELSTEHLENIRKIIDEIAYCMARVNGGMEAIRLLYPYAHNEPDMMRASQTLSQMTTGNGFQLAVYFRLLSENMGKELESRKKNNAL